MMVRGHLTRTLLHRELVLSCDEWLELGIRTRGEETTNVCERQSPKRRLGDG